ncbi:MAG: TonB-dependent receptor [Draconibacterium sp.]|nr:TonB-dependent receptor [Draconibacterium sp.]
MSKKLLNTFFIFLINLLFLLTGFAQDKITVSGVITNAETKQPILYANIAFPELGIGTSSNEKGEFTIQNVPIGSYTFAVTYIGYKEYSIRVTLKKNVDLRIKLKQQSLGLKEVTVTAENSTGSATSSKIKSEAIDHIQASSLKDVLQLVSGNISENPDLSKPSRISIREINDDINSALGTAIIIDDIPFSNDGNMQKSIQSGFPSVAGSGVDIRQISVENIESITVDVGIPSAEHGNLTSGAVHIKTKAGGSPYNVKLQADPRTKQAYLGKGYLLKKDNGVLNVDFGYTNSYQHLYKQTDQFKRINVTTKYSKTFFRNKSPLIINVKLDFLSSLDGEKWDQDMLAEEEHFAKDQSMRGKISAGWSLNKPFITSLSLDAGYSKTWQEGFEKTLENSSSGPNFFSTATTNGEYEIFYGPSSYYSEVTYDGKPFNFYSKLKAKLYRKSDFITNNILLGTEWRTTGNNGDGRIYNLTKPPAGLGKRPRPFSDIPSLNQFSIFLEDKIEIGIANTNLNIMAGIRMDNIQPAGIFSTNGSINLDPRVNINYEIWNRNSKYTLRNVRLRLGYGQTTKAQTLTHLYTDNDYNDIISFNYYPDLIVSTTNVIQDTKNYNLEPAKSSKYEAGIDFQINKIKTRLTGFYEKHEGGFITDRIYYPMFYRDYDILDAGMNPYYIADEGVYYNDKTTSEPIALGFEDDEKFANYSQYRNASTRIKKGVEYSINFGKIKALRTSFVVNGAWLKTESYSTGAPYWNNEQYTIFEGNTSRQEVFAVKFKNRLGYGTVKERLNSNINIITHIPEIKMLVTLTTQVIWYEKDWRIIYENNKLYSLSELRDYLNQPDIFVNDNEEDFYYYLPISYKEYDNIEHQYEIVDFENQLNQQTIKKKQKYLFDKRVLPPLVLCNIKISKDIAQRFKLSFYANNFLNIRPWHLDERSGRYIRRNQEPYFGADIKMQF